MNCYISLFGLINVSLSISINTDSSIFIEDVSTSFLNLGLMLSLPSAGALILTFLAMNGMKTGKKLLLIPMMVFLKVIPILMASLMLISLVVQCQNLTILLNNQNLPLTSFKVGIDILLIFLNSLGFICWIIYFWFVTAYIMTNLEIFYFHNQNTPAPDRQGVDDQDGRDQIEDDGLPPSYDELFDKINEEDDSLPCYEVACEIEAQETTTASMKITEGVNKQYLFEPCEGPRG